jgi:hypothetical protein
MDALRQLFRVLAAAGLATLAIVVCACTSPARVKAEPPQGFPDLNAFTAVDPLKYSVGGRAFVSPEQISCSLDRGPNKSIVCGGNIDGIPAAVTGSGCPDVRKPEGPTDAPYVIARPDGECVTARYVPMHAGQKLSGDNGTCAVGEDNLVACIDADNKHGFVLQPSGSWTF